MTSLFFCVIAALHQADEESRSEGGRRGERKDAFEEGGEGVDHFRYDVIHVILEPVRSARLGRVHSKNTILQS